jgi:pyruvate,water dikinase
MIAAVIRVAKSTGRKIGICGQAPSDYPDFAQFLVEQGIDSISLTPDVILKTTLSILEMEQRMNGNEHQPQQTAANGVIACGTGRAADLVIP